VSAIEFGKFPEREIWAVDCETDPFLAGRVPRPFIWGCYNGCEYHEFETVDQLVAFLQERDCIAYAHNGGRFDWHYCLDHIPAFTPVMVISGRLAKFKIGLAEFRDSYNIMPMPLRAGGKKFEIEDYSIFESGNRDIPGNREIIRERLRTDCLYLYQMLETFFLEFGLHLTISGASMACWARISKEKKPETSAEFYARFAPYYFGGRVETFTKGEVFTPFKIVDINSAYPYAMTFLHPYGVVPHESQSLPNSRAAIQRAFITLTAESHGAFPFRSDDGSLVFPADGSPRRFYVTGWEFLAALETGCLEAGYDIETVLQLPASIEFRSYLDHFYKMKTDAKESGDVARYEFSKRFLCSLYGKFGSNPDNYSEYQLCPPRYIEAACEAEGYSFCAELGPHALLCSAIIRMSKNVSTTLELQQVLPDSSARTGGERFVPFEAVGQRFTTLIQIVCTRQIQANWNCTIHGLERGSLKPHAVMALMLPKSSMPAKRSKVSGSRPVKASSSNQKK
jgi:hypothetical protein